MRIKHMNNITFSKKNVIAHSLFDSIFNNKEARLLSDIELGLNETEFHHYVVFCSVLLCFGTEERNITGSGYNHFPGAREELFAG